MKSQHISHHSHLPPHFLFVILCSKGYSNVPISQTIKIGETLMRTTPLFEELNAISLTLHSVREVLL